MKHFYIIFLVIFSIFFLEQLSLANTQVGGIINSDTTWTSTSSPYSLTSNVQVAYGSTLTINEGVVINGNNHNIKIWGDFIVKGSDNSKIIFNNTNIVPAGNTSPDESYNMDIQFVEINGIV
jgi:hypothetical protein